MTISDLGSLGEFVASIGVLVSLIYLTIQVKQSTGQIENNARSLEVTAYQDLIGRIVDLNKIRLDNIKTVRKAEETPEDLSRAEQDAYVTYLVTLLRHADMAFFQYERGMISYERFRAALGPFYGSLLRSRLARDHLDIVIGSKTNQFTPPFKAELSRLLDEVEDITKGEAHSDLLTALYHR